MSKLFKHDQGLSTNNLGFGADFSSTLLTSALWDIHVMVQRSLLSHSVGDLLIPLSLCTHDLVLAKCENFRGSVVTLLKFVPRLFLSYPLDL